MSVTALRPSRALTRAAATARRRRTPTLLVWGAFALASLLAIELWPSWEMIPFYLLWTSLILVGAARAWEPRSAAVILGCVTVLTAAALARDAAGGGMPWTALVKLPFMCLMFCVIMWRARRRVLAVEVAELRAAHKEALLESQKRFIHDASHELRTPVTIARGHLELARRRSAAPQPEVDIALDELGRMEMIVERLLILAALEQAPHLAPQPIHLETFLEDVFVRWSEFAPRSWRLGELVAGELSADAERLRAALDALLENAVTHTGERSVVELRAVSHAHSEVTIEIEDEGGGVPPDALGRIFERFARADSARTRAVGGAGLGLSIVEAIVHAHGGRCIVRNTLRGAVFALHLSGFVPEAG